MEPGKIRYTFVDPNSAQEVERFLRKLAVEKLLSQDRNQEPRGDSQSG